jgi:DNA replication protein DnaC
VPGHVPGGPILSRSRCPSSSASPCSCRTKVERRTQSTLRLRLRRAAFDPTKTLEGFDFSFDPKLNKAQVFELATCQFVERHENVLIYGPTGVDKSLDGQALAHESCRRGFDVLFIDTAKMLTHLAGGRADGTHEQRLARYTRPALRVLDAFGLRPLGAPGPEDLYDVINERYENASIVLTSNRDRAEWPDLFGETLFASAARDRLTHGAHFVEITGDSVRAEHTKKQATARCPRPAA